MNIHDTFSFTKRIAYADCTLGNHVYYGRYFDILELARGEMFRSLGHSFLELQDQDFIFPVAEVRAKYYGPVRYDDLVEIRTWLIELSNVRLHFAYRIILQDKTVIMEAQTLHACTSLEQNRMVKIPDALRTQLRRFVESD